MVLETFNQELYERNLKEDAYSQGEQADYSKGEQAGYSKGEENMLIKMLRAGLVSVSDAAKTLNLSEEAISKILNNAD